MQSKEVCSEPSLNVTSHLWGTQCRGMGEHPQAVWPEFGDFSWSLLVGYPAWVLIPGGSEYRSGQG